MNDRNEFKIPRPSPGMIDEAEDMKEEAFRTFSPDP